MPCMSHPASVSQPGVQNQAPLLLHFDVNKTVIQSDSIQLKSIEDGVREGIAELFWGNTRKDGDKTHWEWTHNKPSCLPPNDDIRMVGTTLVNYAQYCKEVVKDKAERKEAVKNFSLLPDTSPVKTEMEKLLRLTMKKMELPQEVRYSKEAEAAGIKGLTYNMFPTLFHLVANLQRSKRTFAVLFRSFGADHEKIQQEWNAFCQLRHPIFSRLIEDIGPLDGTVPGVPDRRINALHTLYRDAQGPVLILDTFTNGPHEQSWDAWAKTKNPKTDTRNGRAFIQTELKSKTTVEGIGNIQKWMSKHLMNQQTAAIKDDWAWWQFNNEQSQGGKLLCLIGGRKTTQQIFFDDNIDHSAARIVDCRDPSGAAMAATKVLGKLIVKVNPVEAMLDNDYFLRKLHHSMGDNLDMGASMMAVTKQLNEADEENAQLRKDLEAAKTQLKMVSEENRRLKQQRRVQVRDEGELQHRLAQHYDVTQFGQAGRRSIADLYRELEEGTCWLEMNDQNQLVRVMDMIFLKIYFKDVILIETHETDGTGNIQTRNYLPGIIQNVHESSIQTQLQKWFENGLQVNNAPVNLRRSIEITTFPVGMPDAPLQKTSTTEAYPMTTIVQQSQGTCHIDEKEASLNKDLLSKIGLPAAKHFTTTEKDLHGGTIQRFWRWDKKTTFEDGPRNATAPIPVTETCEKLFKGHPRYEQYKMLLLQMFDVFEAQKLTGGFSGSVVIRVQPFDTDGRGEIRPGEPCIVKLDSGSAIREEYKNSVKVFEALPDRAARILGDPVYTGSTEEEFGAMRLELAGACWNVPELAHGSTNLLSTFKDLLLYESEQALLGGSNDDRPFGNANSVLAETFGPGGVVPSLRKGSFKREERKPLPMSWYTLKGKEGKYNLFTAKKGEYPPADAMKRLYKEHFGGDFPKLKDIVQGGIKPQLEKLDSSSAGNQMRPLIGLAHGDLNAANIMIDALDAVWVIDFATSIPLPLFTDMCKFEMACLFEYAIIPITPKMFLEFAGTQESAWAGLNVGDWLRVDQEVTESLLKKFTQLTQERLTNLTQSDLEQLIDQAVKSSNKAPHKQKKMERAIKARLVADEALTGAAFAYCLNISNMLLQGDYVKETLEIKPPPLQEGRGARGATSLKFFMEIVNAVRRFASQDIIGSVLRDQSKNNELQAVDWLSLQLWLPFLRESFRIIGYGDIAPQYKVWAAYHCKKTADNVARILTVINKNLSKLENMPGLAALKKELDSGKSHFRSEKTSQEDQVADGLQAVSDWVHAHPNYFPQSVGTSKVIRKVHTMCPVHKNEPGFYAPIWQVYTPKEGEEAPLRMEFLESGQVVNMKTSSGTSWELCIEVPRDEVNSSLSTTKVPIGYITSPNKGEPVVQLRSRLFPMKLGFLRQSEIKATEKDRGPLDKLGERFDLSTWSAGVDSDGGATAKGGDKRRNSGGENNLYKWQHLDVDVLDQQEKRRMVVTVILGVPVYCYPSGANLCLDASVENNPVDQMKSPHAVVWKLADSTGNYQLISTEDQEIPFDPVPNNHTYITPCLYKQGQQILMSKSDESGWVDAQVISVASLESKYLHEVQLMHGGKEDPNGPRQTRHLSHMNSSKNAGVINALVYEEESTRIKQYYRARHSFIIDSLSGAKLAVKECAAPTLKIGGTNFAAMGDNIKGRNAARLTVVAATFSSGSENESEAKVGWNTIMSTVEVFEKGLPSCSPNAFLILGSPGSGKTCLVCRLIMETLDRNANMVPLLLPVADLVKRSAQDVEKMLSPAVISDWFDKYLRVTWGEDSYRYLMICQAIRMKKALFIFEGLEDCGELKPVVEACIRQHILNRDLVIVTSRPLIPGQSSLEELIGENMIAMYLHNLSEAEIRTVALSRLGPTGIESFDHIFMKLKRSQGSVDQQNEQDESETHEEVFGNPMMLSMLLCYLQTMQKKELERREAAQRGEEPEDRKEEVDEASITAVYRVAIDVMLQRVQSKSQGDRFLKERNMERSKTILETVALEMLLRHKEGIEAGEVQALLPAALWESWKTLRQAVAAGHAMFLRIATDTGKEEMRFLVKEFQNFFAASAIAHVGDKDDKLAGYEKLPGHSLEKLPGYETLVMEPKWWSQMLEMLAEAWPRRYVELIEKRLDKFQATNGDTWLHIAGRFCHLPIFQNFSHFSKKNREALKEKNNEQRTCLHVAAETGNKRLCELMIENGVPMNVLDSQDRLAIHVAMQKKFFPCAKFLMQKWTEKHEDGVQKIPFRTKKSADGADEMAKKIINNTSSFDEAAFTKEIEHTFVEMNYFGEKEQVDKDRTIGALLAVYWIASNHYEQFVRGQKPEAKMKKQNWEKLQEWTKNKVSLKSPASTLCAALVFVAIMNLGKIGPFRKAFAPDFEEPTEALASILQKQPLLVPSFSKLDENLQQAILAALKVEFNFGQFLQAENLPTNLDAMKKSLLQSGGGVGGSLDILNFYLFRTMAAMCGLLAPKSVEGSLFMIDRTYENFKVGLDVLDHLKNESAQWVYDYYLQQRGASQGLHLNVRHPDPESRARVRLACLTRAFDKDGGKEVAAAFDALEPLKRKALTQFLNADGIEQKPGFLIFKSPDIMENSRKNPKLGVLRGMQMLLNIYEAAAKEYAGTQEALITIIADDIADHTKTSNDDDSYLNTNFEITRTAGYKSATQATVHKSAWQPVNDQQILEGYSEEAFALVGDVMHNGVRETAFLKRIHQIFPELKFLTDENDPTNRQVLKETTLGLLIVYWTASDQADAFTRSQDLDMKLLEKSWSRIRELMKLCGLISEDEPTKVFGYVVRDHVGAHETLNAVFSAMVLHSLWKLKKFRAQLAPEAGDHREVMAHVLHHSPKVLPSYWRLEPNYRKLVAECLGRPFDFEQFLHAELVPASITTIKEMLLKDRGGDLTKKQYLHLFIYIVFAQLSASLGVKSLEGSLYMTEDKWQEFQVGLEAMRNLDQENELAIYDRILHHRANLWGFKFDERNQESRAMARIACLCSVSDREDVKKVQEAFDSLEPEGRVALTKYLTADGISQKPGFVLIDACAFLRNALANQQAKVNLGVALRVLLKVCRETSSHFNRTTRPILTIKLDRLAVFTKDFAGAVSFQDMPFELQRLKDGEAVVIPKVWIPVNNQDVLSELRKQGRELAMDLMKSSGTSTITDKQFRTKVKRIFPELNYFPETATTQRDQTMCAMLAVFWLLTNSHDAFVRGQPDEDQLSKQSWAWIQEWMKKDEWLSTEEGLDAMLAFMAIHALGKIKEFREEHAPNFDHHMHDKALAGILEKQPEVVPSFNRLDKKYKRLIIDSLSVDFQFNQFLQAENVPANLVVVKDKLGEHGEEGFAFFCFRIFAQMCGKKSEGGTTLQGSLFMTERQFQRFRPGLDALKDLRNSEADQAYNKFLLLQGSKALSKFASPEHQALTRLLCLGSASDYESGDCIRGGWDELTHREREKLTRLLTADGVRVTPGYVLCEAQELFRNAQAKPEVGITAALRLLVQVAERCYADKRIKKVFVHLQEVADWVQDAEDIDECLQCRLEMIYEDRDESRSYRIEVTRPNGKRAGVDPEGRKSKCSCFKACVWYFVWTILFLAMLAAGAGAAGLYFIPEKLEPYTEMLPVEEDIAMLAMAATAGVTLLLFFVCCLQSLCCKGPGRSRRLMRSDSGAAARPLLCSYTLLDQTSDNA